ncbi:MAG: hypothetical protein J6X58_00785 [Bacteroidales bacterium]|nr:hypothetical protein [Bacteroidales bacterium]
MNKTLTILIALCLLGGSLYAQTSKKDRKKNMVVNEWNIKEGSTTRFLDHVTTYDSLGRKIEEIEYASYGQKNRVVYEYSGTSRKVSREIVYNDKNKPVRIKKYEYDAEGNKVKQTNYKPNGKRESVKTFEYSYR